MELSPAPPHLVLQEPIANALEGDTNGIEIAPDWKPTNWWELKGSYSYLHLLVKDRPGFTDTSNTAADNGSSPHHEVTVQSLFNLPRKLELDATYRYVSTISYVSAFPREHIKAYFLTGDARLGWHPSPTGELSVVGQNLLQTATRRVRKRRSYYRRHQEKRVREDHVEKVMVNTPAGSVRKGKIVLFVSPGVWRWWCSIVSPPLSRSHLGQSSQFLRRKLNSRLRVRFV